MPIIVQTQPTAQTEPIDLIAGALRSIRAVESGEPIDPQMASDAFYMLNNMLDMWSNEKLMVYYISEITKDISGATAWTIGSGGQIDVPRPLRINSAFVRVSHIDYPVDVLNVEQYELIGLKQLNGPWPRALYYQPKEPLGVINFWPLPSSGEIHLFADTVFTRFNTINDAVILPQGFNMAIHWNLAMYLMPEYGKASQEQIAMIRDYAREGKALIKRTNMQPQRTARFDSALLTGSAIDAGWIMSGGFR